MSRARILRIAYGLSVGASAVLALDGNLPPLTVAAVATGLILAAVVLSRRSKQMPLAEGVNVGQRL
jgi:hypothetical protein